MAWLRTALFNLIFYGASVPIVLAAPVTARLFGKAALRKHARLWVRFHRFVARWTIGIRIAIEGEVPTGQVLYVCKHQSLFETFELLDRLDEPAIVLKRELADIPAWGWVAREYGVIVVDREANAAAMRSMIRDARAALAAGRSVLIFAEGTRVRPGETPPLRAGFAGLYRALGLPTVPIAMNSGEFWPKKGTKRAGTIIFRFAPPIAPGGDRVAVEREVHAAINALEGAYRGAIATESAAPG
nr:lysophospholipid acyltransferase family protein [Sphingomonas japonica]